MAEKAIKTSTFAWEGTDRRGSKIKGEMNGQNPALIKAQLRKQGILVTKVNKASTLFGKRAKPIKPLDIAFFTRQLATMMESGVPIVQAFGIDPVHFGVIMILNAGIGKLGLPPALAYATMTVEVVGALALILGLWARLAALVLIPVLLGAIVTVHGANGFFFNNAGGGWEFPAFWAVALFAQALLGDGALALRPTPLPAASRRPAHA